MIAAIGVVLFMIPFSKYNNNIFYAYAFENNDADRAAATETITTATSSPDENSGIFTETTPIVTDTDNAENINVMQTDTTSDETDLQFSIGDLDNDGNVNISDAIFILNIYACNAAQIENNFTAEQNASSDCNGDGHIGIDDAMLVLKYYAEKAAGIIDISFEDYVYNPPVTTTAIPGTTETTTTETITTESTSESTTTTTANTTSTTTTTTTTETILSTSLDVKCILQNSSPSLPTGCEATALTIALNYYGFNADKYDIAMNYLPRMNFTGGYGADFRYVFPGNPSTSSGYGCYAPAITATANAYFTANKNASFAEDITGTEFSDLYEYINAGTPVVFIATMGMKAPYYTSSWKTPDGNTVTWKAGEHCLVLIGYDRSKGTVLVSDPLRGNVEYDAALVKQRYNDMGKNAVIVHKSDQYSGEVPYVVSGNIYRLRNSGSGLYLTVADGKNENGTNVIQKDADDSLSQQFKILYDSDSNSYKLLTMCSSDGNDKVADIAKIGGCVVSGSNVQIYTQVDPPAQTFVIESYPDSDLSLDGTVRLSCRTNRSACLSVNGSSSGTASGNAYASSGNAVIRTFTGEPTQLWYLEPVE